MTERDALAAVANRVPALEDALNEVRSERDSLLARAGALTTERDEYAAIAASVPGLEERLRRLSTERGLFRHKTRRPAPLPCSGRLS